ncbi:MAG: Smr/MutS family protein [Planctomycetota bacterium]|jgi:hypothetical protein
MRECLVCGMFIEPGISHCPKCDAPLAIQHDGSTMSVDIAHHGQTVDQAERELAAAVSRARDGYCQYLRVVVGGGLIRDRACRYLRGHDLAWTYDGRNRGAVLVTMR